MKASAGGRKKNNRGASLISVIIAMSVVSLLGVSIIYAAYSNLTRQLVDRSAKSGFYSAETAVDEILAGLQSELGEAFNGAYTEVMAKYGILQSAEEMDQEFSVNVITAVVEALHQKTELADDGSTVTEEDFGSYSLNLLKSYVDTAKYPGSLSISADNGDNRLDTLSDAVVLRNIRVSCQNGGYENTIITDIEVSVPEVRFTRVSSLPNLSDYANIAQEGIQIGGNCSLTLNGEVFAGSTSVSGSGAGGDSVTLSASGARLDLRNCGLLTAAGSILLGGGSTLITGEDTSLWTAGITLKSSAAGTDAGNELTLQGRTYVQDDLTLSGAKNKLTLSGSYFGLGDGDTADESSSIIINGRGTTVDMSGADTLVLLGTAYVGGSSATGNASGYAGANTDVKTGESVAVRSNQLAYLVPTDCEGISANPMSYEQYRKLTNNGTDTEWETKALKTILPDLGASISSYGEVRITPVFMAEQGGSVYLFLNFADTDAAATYFLDVYSSEGRTGEQLREYLPVYLSGFSFPVEESAGQVSLTRLVTEGNYLMPGTYNSDTMSWEQGVSYSGAVSVSGNISAELTNYRTAYRALCAKLVSSTAWLTDEELGRNVYQNLIDEEKISEVLKNGNGAAGDGAVISDVVMKNGEAESGKIVFTGSGSRKAIIVKGDLQLDSTETASGGLIIATGDVTISRNFSGVIIAGGQIRVTANVTLNADSEALGECLRLHCTLPGDGGEESLIVTEFFIGGEGYLGNSAEETQKVTEVSDCVRLQNWRSE